MAVARGFLRPPGWRMRVRGEKDAEWENEARDEEPRRTRCFATSKGSTSESYDTSGDGIAARPVGWIRPDPRLRHALRKECPVCMAVILQRPEQTGRLRQGGVLSERSSCHTGKRPF